MLLVNVRNTYIGFLSVVPPIIIQSVCTVITVIDRFVMKHSTAVWNTHRAGFLARRIRFLWE